MDYCINCGQKTDNVCDQCGKPCCDSCLKVFTGNNIRYCPECTTIYGDDDN